MERLNHSDGPKKVQTAIGKTRFPGQGGDPSDLVYFIRQNHPHYFERGSQVNKRSQRLGQLQMSAQLEDEVNTFWN